MQGRLPLRRSLALLLAVSGLALGAAPAAHAAPMRADLDRDGVFDDLEQRARELGAGEDVRVIVSLVGRASAERAARLERSVPGLAIRRRFSVVDAVAGVVDAARVRRLAAEPDVLHVEEDARVRASNASAQDAFGVAKARLDVPSLDGDRDGNPTSYSPGDLVAAVIDTGIHASHSDLNGGKVLAFQDFTELPYDTALDAPYDDNGHGTHVAGTISGHGTGDGRGVAPRSALVGLKVLDRDGNGWSSDVIAAIDWVWKDPDGAGPAVPNGVTYGIEALNLSLGGTGCANGTDLESQAVNHASNAGYVVAVAAGNDGPAGCTGSTGISSPAAAQNAITVAAMADVSQGGFYLAGFSSRGPTLDGRIKPDIAAPGVAIRSARSGTSTGYATASGTSMAAPFVAGVALLMRDANPLLTPAQVKQRLMQSAVDWGVPGADPDHGAGRLDAYAALAAAVSGSALTSPPTHLPRHQRFRAHLAGAGSTQLYSVAGTSGVPLTAGLTAPAGADFDMTLYDSQGLLVVKAETPHRQDELHIGSGSAGPYTLEVVSFSGSGDFYLDISGGTATGPGLLDGPVNRTAPTLAVSDLRDGGTVQAAVGSWDGSGPISYSLRWQRCDAAGGACAEVAGAASRSYTLGPGDVGARMRVVVTATNQAGAATAISTVTGVVAGKVPATTRPVAVSGTPLRGATLTADDGAWTASGPVTARRQWVRCAPAGGTCAPIAGQTATTYTLTRADLGHLVGVDVVATAHGQSTTATATSPVVIDLPALAGAVRHGRKLSVAGADWGAGRRSADSYRWLRCRRGAARCEAIRGASGHRYRLRAKDVGARVQARIKRASESSTIVATTRQSRVVGAAVTRVARPAVTGRAARGRRLVAAGGSWWGTPRLGFAVQWMRCARSGRSCRAIRGATRAAYVPRRPDVGRRLRVRVTAASRGSSRRASSRPTALVRSLPMTDRRVRDGARRLRVRVANEPGGRLVRRSVLLPR